jgi:predicted nuclease of predicted toxin-antitoxin system
MKLLLDHNLSPRLVARLDDVFPDCTHTAHCGLGEATDTEVWSFAQSQSYTIVTKDSDFADLSVLRGSPPKVVILHIGNCTTTQLEDALRRSADSITAFVVDAQASVLHLLRAEHP